MRYALNTNKDRIQVSSSGEIATCEICKSEVRGKKGQFRIKHWFHKSKIDCDNWYEPITDWHLDWQNLFPKKNREVVIKQNNISHRADVQLDNGLVIEVQNSPISVNNIEKRELFYGKKNMLWILNGHSLTDKSKIEFKIFEYPKQLAISIPEKLPFIESYDFKLVLNEVLELREIGELRSSGSLIEFKIKNGTEIIFKFYKNIFNDESLHLIHLKYYIECAYRVLYKNEGYEEFRNQIQIEYKTVATKIIKISLLKKYWRKFIDEMKFPVFIDNLNGLNDNQLYWYNKNKIIDKNNFIKKYLKYT